MRFIVTVSHKLEHTYSKVVEAISREEAKKKISLVLETEQGEDLEDIGFERQEDCQIEEPKVSSVNEI